MAFVSKTLSGGLYTSLRLGMKDGLLRTMNKAKSSTRSFWSVAERQSELKGAPAGSRRKFLRVGSTGGGQLCLKWEKWKKWTSQIPLSCLRLLGGCRSGTRGLWCGVGIELTWTCSLDQAWTMDGVDWSWSCLPKLVLAYGGYWQVLKGRHSTNEGTNGITGLFRLWELFLIGVPFCGTVSQTLIVNDKKESV